MNQPNFEISQVRKEKVAAIVRFPLVSSLLELAVRITVARHRTGVAVVCLDEIDRVFLLRHVFHPAVPWGLPGGWLSVKEKPSTCALRELKEETGLSASLGPVVHVTRLNRPDHIVIAYLATVNGGIPNLSHEILEADWFDLDNLPSPLFPYTKEAIKAALTYKRYLGSDGVERE